MYPRAEQPALVLHLISNLMDGGAERTLYRLCASMPPNCNMVVCMMDEGKYGPLLEEKGIQVFYLRMPQGKVTIQGIFSFFRILIRYHPKIMQTWMYHADLLGGIVGRLFGIKKIVWGIRHGNLSPGTVKPQTIMIAKLCSYLSYIVPDRIVNCSQRSSIDHVKFGYKKEIFTVIPNGYDTSEYTIDCNARLHLRKAWGVEDSLFLIGMVARYDIQKDHDNLFSALKFLEQRKVSFRCLLVGAGIVTTNTMLLNSIKKHGVQNMVSFLGPRRDIAEIMNALDIHVLSSLGEAFPNVLAEAMACGTPCISTDVGDARYIVGDTGWIVPPRNAELLANSLYHAYREMLFFSDIWKMRQLAARKRIISKFSMNSMIASYADAWQISKP
jgi:glycosyltransferase involved in cell wall biosynthesis